jgi:hypothetical protein
MSDFAWYKPLDGAGMLAIDLHECRLFVVRSCEQDPFCDPGLAFYSTREGKWIERLDYYDYVDEEDGRGMLLTLREAPSSTGARAPAAHDRNRACPDPFGRRSISWPPHRSLHPGPDDPVSMLMLQAFRVMSLRGAGFAIALRFTARHRPAAPRRFASDPPTLLVLEELRRGWRQPGRRFRRRLRAPFRNRPAS